MMIRKTTVGVLITLTVIVATVWAWCSYWEGAIGGWDVRFGSVTLGYGGYGYDLFLSLGDRTFGWATWKLSSVAGFGYQIGQNHAYFFVPFWFPVVLFICYPAYVLIRGHIGRRIVQERQAAGRCTQCRYDLTGLPTPRCPECSTIAPCGAISNRRTAFLRISDRCLLFVGLAVGLCFLIQTVGFLIASMVSPRFGLDFYVAEFVWRFPYLLALSGATGLAWCSFGTPLLARKPIRSIVIPLALAAFFGSIVAVFVEIVAAESFSFYGMIAVLIVLPTIALLGACLVLRRLVRNRESPRRHPSAEPISEK